MYKLLQYYLGKDEVRFHIVSLKDTKKEINEFKTDLVKRLNKNDISVYEVIDIENIDSLKEVLKQENVFYFKVIKD